MLDPAVSLTPWDRFPRSQCDRGISSRGLNETTIFEATLYLKTLVSTSAKFRLQDKAVRTVCKGELLNMRILATKGTGTVSSTIISHLNSKLLT
jgi:hypothetical protein